jgi:hypothetical protein
VQRGAGIYAESCANAFCHGPNGTQGPAPSLAKRALDASYIERVVTYGFSGHNDAGMGVNGCPGQELGAVNEYVKSLNATTSARAVQLPRQLSGEAARGRQLFGDEVMGFWSLRDLPSGGRCGCPGRAADDPLPADVAQLRTLAAAHVATAV